MYEQIAIQKKLSEKFSDLKLKNPLYSLRAFSRKLGMSSSSVSEILNGKRRVSVKMVDRISDRLCLDPKEKVQLLSLFPHGKNGGAHNRQSMQLSMDQFHVISSWVHFAIISLSETDGFQDDPTWIARRLGSSLREVKGAVERLERLGMLKRDEAGILRSVHADFSTTDDIPSSSLRKSHAQTLEKAKESLERDATHERDFTAVTMAIDPDKLKDAKKLVREFRDKLYTYLESGRKKEVYKLHISLFPLSQKMTIKDVP